MKINWVSFFVGWGAAAIVAAIATSVMGGSVCTLPYGDQTCVVRRSDGTALSVTHIEVCYPAEAK